MLDLIREFWVVKRRGYIINFDLMEGEWCYELYKQQIILKLRIKLGFGMD